MEMDGVRRGWVVDACSGLNMDVDVRLRREREEFMRRGGVVRMV